MENLKACCWVYLETEHGVFTTGHYDGHGSFIGDKDFGSREMAALRCNYLNGGNLNDKQLMLITR